MRPSRLVLCGLLIAFVGCRDGGGGPTGPEERSGDRPNLLLLVSDDQGTVLGCYGEAGVQTPRLDALAAGGVRFTRAYAPSGVCTPSRTSIYTGLMPAQHGANGFRAVGEDVRLWGSYFAEAGYRTGLIGKLGAKPIGRFAFDFMARSNKDESDARTVEWHLAELDRFLDEGDAKPWVLVVNFRDSHWPFPTDGAPVGEGTAEPHAPADVTVPAALVDTPVVRAELARYYDGLRRMDATVGAIVDRVEERDLARRTIGLFTSDNGPPFPFAKTTVYEAGIHMPLIAWNVGESREVQAFASLVDILPTFLDYAGVAGKGSFDGRSLRPLLEGGDSVADKIGWRDAVFATHDSHRAPPDVPSRSVRFGDWKYIRTWGEGLVFRNLLMQTSESWRELVRVADEGDAEVAARLTDFVRRPSEELFDLSRDPDELVNLAEDPAAAAALARGRELIAGTEWVDLPGKL